MSEPSDVPAVFAPYLEGLEEQRFTALPTDQFHRCFGCGPAHPTGLRVRTFRTADGVVSPVVVPRVYEGPPGAVHGGIVAAYLDEILSGAVVRGTGRLAVTGELTVRYVAPAPSETPLLGRGRVVTDHGRYIDVEASLETLADKKIVATARARFFPIADK